jgi:hypothetical protein
MRSARTRSESSVPIGFTAVASVSLTSSARLLHAAPTADLGALIGDFHALVSHGAPDVDTAEVAAKICRKLRSLSTAEMEILERTAQGMPPDAAQRGSACEDEDADPVGPLR